MSNTAKPALNDRDGGYVLLQFNTAAPIPAQRLSFMNGTVKSRVGK